MGTKSAAESGATPSHHTEGRKNDGNEHDLDNTASSTRLDDSVRIPDSIRCGDLVRDRMTGHELRVCSIEDTTALCSRIRPRGTIVVPIADLFRVEWDLGRRVLAAMPTEMRVLLPGDDEHQLEVVRTICNLAVEAMNTEVAA